jgi:hypothetical protein
MGLKYLDPSAPEVQRLIHERIRGMSRDEWLQRIAAESAPPLPLGVRLDVETRAVRVQGRAPRQPRTVLVGSPRRKSPAR